MLTQTCIRDECSLLHGSVGFVLDSCTDPYQEGVGSNREVLLLFALPVFHFC